MPTREYASSGVSIPFQAHSFSIAPFYHTGPSQLETAKHNLGLIKKLDLATQANISTGKEEHTSVRTLRIAARMFIFGKLPSGRGSSQFFNRVKTP